MNQGHKLIFVGLVSIAAAGCLKTRGQVRSDEQELPANGKPVQAHVEQVDPEGYAVDEIKSEITRLTGRLEDLERDQKQNQSENTLKEEVKKLEARLAEQEKAQAELIETVKKLQAMAPAVDAVETFEKGKALLKDNDFEGAAEAFSTYLKNPKGKHFEEATFLRAEAYFAEKQHKKAIVDYSKFPEKYTKSKHLPVALYKIGLCFDALGMKEDSKGFYQELIEKFPKSPEAKKARKKLK